SRRQEPHQSPVTEASSCPELHGGGRRLDALLAAVFLYPVESAPDHPAESHVTRSASARELSVRVLVRDLSHCWSTLHPPPATFQRTGGEQLLPKRARVFHGGKRHADERFVRVVDRARDLVRHGTRLRSTGRVLVESRLPRVIVVDLEMQEQDCH